MGATFSVFSISKNFHKCGNFDQTVKEIAEMKPVNVSVIRQLYCFRLECHYFKRIFVFFRSSRIFWKSRMFRMLLIELVKQWSSSSSVENVQIFYGFLLCSDCLNNFLPTTFLITNSITRTFEIFY